MPTGHLARRRKPRPGHDLTQGQPRRDEPLQETRRGQGWTGRSGAWAFSSSGQIDERDLPGAPVHFDELIHNSCMPTAVKVTMVTFFLIEFDPTPLLPGPGA